ncbi:MAG: hypothetical protein IJR27_00900 [Synergistaceae bacterium]|nr:hypothetical protein [Synergistaceae bacterium]
MIKQFIKSLLGEKNTQRVIRLKSSVEAAKSAWRSFGNTQPEKSSLTTSLLISVHMLEKASVIGNVKYLGAVKYNDLINKISRLIETGVPPEDFSIAESVAVIKSTLRRRFGISGSEVIVCCIGIGELEDEVSCACAQRRPVETVAVNLDS